MLKHFKLKNGLNVATYKLPNLRSVHLQMAVKGGSLVETPENNGVAHFMEHMLVQGIPSYPNVEEFSGYIERLAGSYGAFTDSLNVGFTITVPNTHIEDAVKIASEVFFEPLFVEEAIDKERRVIVEEITQRMDSHWYKINNYFRKTRFGETHPLTLNPGGTVEVIEKLTREDLMNYWKEYFVPKNTWLIVTGNFEFDQLEKLLNDYFGKYDNPAEFSGFPKMGNSDFSKRQIALRHDAGLSTNYVDLAFPSMSLEHPLEERIRENLALIVLGGLRNSRLFKLLRYQRGLVYHVSCGASLWPGLGYIYASCEVSSANLDEVVSLLTQQISTFMTNGPTVEELEFVKHYLSNQWMMAFDHPSAIAGWIENDLLWNDQIRLPEDYVDMIKDITVDDLRELMQKHWDLKRLNVTIQGAVKDNAATLKHIEEFVKL